MKIHILSDVHNEFTRLTPPKTIADVVVLAGDIDIGIAGVVWAKNTLKCPQSMSQETMSFMAAI